MIEIFGKPVCSYCDQVKKALDHMGVVYTYIDIEEDEDAREFILNQGYKTVPQLYYNKVHYGGSEGLVDLLEDWEKDQ